MTSAIERRGALCHVLGENHDQLRVLLGVELDGIERSALTGLAASIASCSPLNVVADVRSAARASRCADECQRA